MFVRSNFAAAFPLQLFRPFLPLRCVHSSRKPRFSPSSSPSATFLLRVFPPHLPLDERSPPPHLPFPSPARHFPHRRRFPHFGSSSCIVWLVGLGCLMRWTVSSTLRRTQTSARRATLRFIEIGGAPDPHVFSLAASTRPLRSSTPRCSHAYRFPFPFSLLRLLPGTSPSSIPCFLSSHFQWQLGVNQFQWIGLKQFQWVISNGFYPRSQSNSHRFTTSASVRPHLFTHQFR